SCRGCHPAAHRRRPCPSAWRDTCCDGRESRSSCQRRGFAPGERPFVPPSGATIRSPARRSGPASRTRCPRDKRSSRARCHKFPDSRNSKLGHRRSVLGCRVRDARRRERGTSLPRSSRELLQLFPVCKRRDGDETVPRRPPESVVSSQLPAIGLLQFIFRPAQQTRKGRGSQRGVTRSGAQPRSARQEIRQNQRECYSHANSSWVHLPVTAFVNNS